jgi:hypothetical protein
LEKRDKGRWLHVVCPPFFIATRQRCGGACREELGGLWVAFFLTTLLLFVEPTRSTAKPLGMRCLSASQQSLTARRIWFHLCNPFAAGMQPDAIY